jgi:hypothetical protein
MFRRLLPRRGAGKRAGLSVWSNQMVQWDKHIRRQRRARIVERVGDALFYAIAAALGVHDLLSGGW